MRNIRNLRLRLPWLKLLFFILMSFMFWRDSLLIKFEGIQGVIFCCEDTHVGPCLVYDF